eukprot:10576347-Lingulodinium_polyedra.AAC.1
MPPGRGIAPEWPRSPERRSPRRTSRPRSSPGPPARSLASAWRTTGWGSRATASAPVAPARPPPRLQARAARARSGE